MNLRDAAQIRSATLNDAPFAGGIGASLESAQLGIDYHWQGPIELCATHPRIGIVGTRTPATESEAAMVRLAANLAMKSATIVSGAALGVDFAAHRGALVAGGATIACVPFGLKTVNLSTWRGGLLDPAMGRTLAISSFASHQQVTTQTPVLRNRLTAALSEVLILGEAGMKSGTHHCRGFAEELSVPIFFLTGFAHGDANLLLAHDSWRRRNASPFSIDQVDDENFLNQILAAAAAFAASEHAAHAAQLKLLPESPW